MSGRPFPGPGWALHLFLVLAVAAATLLGPRCGGDPPPPATVEDGTEVDDTTWFMNGINFRNRIGVKDLESHDLGLRFETPDLVQGQQVAYARIVLPVTGDGSVNGSLPLDIVGLDVDYVDFFSNLRPSENPSTLATAPWLITQNWPGFTEAETYSCVPLRRYSPDVSAIVNEILARPTWGGGPEKNIGLVIQDGNAPAVVGDNFVTTQDTTGYGGCSNQHAARLEVFETVRDTFLGKELLGRITDQSVVVNAWSLLPVDVYFEWGTSPGAYTHSTSPVSYAPETTIEHTISGLAADTPYFYRMRYRETGAPSFDTGPERSFRTQRPPESTYTFVIQADSHIQNRFTNGNQDGLDLYLQTLVNALADAPDFMVDLGDTFHAEYIQGRNLEDLDEGIHRHLDQRPYLDTINHSVPLFLVLGNHEGELGWERDGSADNLAVWATTARKLIYPNPVPDSFYSGSQTSEPFVGLRESYYSFEWGDALFVVLDPFWNTTLKPHDLGGPATGDRWDWTLGFTQYDWLRTTLEQSSARFKFVFSHHVAGGITDYGRGGIKAAKHAIGGDGSYEWGGEDPDGTYVFDTKRPGWGLPIHDLMAANNVTAFFTGHDHVFVQETLDDVLYVEVPQPSNVSYNKGFPENSDNYVGTLVNNSGHLRVTVSGTRVDADYVRAYLPGDGTNGTVAVEMTIFDCNRNGFVDSEEGLVCACQDGVDNDGDTAIDFPADPECSAPEDLTETLACADGLDNDGDALTDLADPGCADALDDSEKDAGVECDDWQDNDADGLIDLADPDCVDPTDTTESGTLPECSDTVDNDGDGLADHPADPGCDDALDADERSAALVCDNGIDDDFDGLIDFPADPQCGSPTGPTETGECNDAADNDGDTLIDLADPGCDDAVDGSELSLLECDNGVDDDGDTLIDTADPGCTDPSDASEQSAVACDNGVDDDGDTLIDTADPGCTDPSDASEQSAVACDNGVDDDGDTLIDTADPGCTDPSDASEQSAVACDNGVDDDGDTLIDTADPGCTDPSDASEQSAVACDNGVDDDGDTLIDTADPGCTDPSDASEQSAVACDNGVDDDLDTLVDTLDPGCTGPSDGSEQNPAVACDDGVDNDGDTLVDVVDPGCSGPVDVSEQDGALVCDDGADNDADGLVDAADPGCAGPLDASEQDPAIACDNGVDDDADSLIDTADPGCTDPSDGSELDPGVACDDGIDNDGDTFIDLLDPGCSDPTDPSELNPGDTEVIFEDTFTRINNDVLGPAEIGGTWVEVSDGNNNNDADVNANQMRFYSSGSNGTPLVSNTFAARSTGVLEWSMEFTWDRDSFDNSYSFFLQIGNSAFLGVPPGDGADVPGAAINLRWGDDGHGFSSEEAFGYVQGTTQTEVAVIQGTHTIDIIADLDAETFDIEIDASPVATGVAFDKSLATLGSVDTVRFYVAESISTFLVPDGRLDTIRIQTVVPVPACDDGADNDGDSLVDLADPGCTGVTDGSEQDPGLVCDDGVDNDADTLVDVADPGCSGPTDASEQDPALACDDGIDNDSDGLTDVADPGCADPIDPSEQNPSVQCDDGIDNDADTLIDTADPDCASPADPLESPLPACSDGIDNDSDGDIDFPADDGCSSAADPLEELSLPVVDDVAAKIFGYLDDGTFLGAVSLAPANTDAEGAAEVGGDLYVADDDVKRIFHYSGTTGALIATSAVMRDDNQNTIPDVDGLAIDGDDVWVVGLDGGSPRMWRYSLADLFSGSGTEDALQAEDLDGDNGEPSGLAIDGTYAYVLDANERRFFRYEFGDFEEFEESRRLEESNGSNLTDPSGASLVNGSMWVVDRSSDEAYRYPLSSLFSSGGNISASDEFALDAANTEPQGL